MARTAAAAKVGSALRGLAGQGQSLWIDYIRRDILTSGELEALRDEGVTGVTSNPTIFEQAVSTSTDYDRDLVHLVRAGKKPEAILWRLMVDDVRAAADIFAPVWGGSKGTDG
ncbi:MAG TPA: transaldolase family protein, partial [Chloroflexota bacterium]|nr:transaldolase family protein [Chloroflexota bacterium]